ncbi:hypothetical protein BH23GEM9_BH23GEM9_07200 [soil metagenome]
MNRAVKTTDSSHGSVRQAGALAGLIAVAVLALAAAPRSAAGAEEAGPGTVWRQCMDGAWADYNSCLMEADGWLHRKVCDLAFELDVVYCTAKTAGEIRNAWNGNL